MAEDRGTEGGEEEVTAGEVKVTDSVSAGEGDSEAEAAASESAGPGASADAAADAHDEPGLVGPDQATTHARRSPPPPPPPPSQLPTTPRRPPSPPPLSQLPIIPPVPPTSTSTPTPPAPEPAAPSDPIPLADTTTPATTTTTTMTQGPRKRKDAVLRTTRPSIDPSNADALADADDAAMRAAALFSRVADLGAGLFDGAVRERGAALWTAFSRHRTSPEVPVPPLPRTRFAAPGERS
jgi:hypothetical protein